MGSSPGMWGMCVLTKLPKSIDAQLDTLLLCPALFLLCLREEGGDTKEFLLKHINNWVCRVYCHKVSGAVVSMHGAYAKGCAFSCCCTACPPSSVAPVAYLAHPTCLSRSQ